MAARARSISCGGISMPRASWRRGAHHAARLLHSKSIAYPARCVSFRGCMARGISAAATNAALSVAYGMRQHARTQNGAISAARPQQNNNMASANNWAPRGKGVMRVSLAAGAAKTEQRHQAADYRRQATKNISIAMAGIIA